MNKERLVTLATALRENAETSHRLRQGSKEITVLQLAQLSGRPARPPPRRNKHINVCFCGFYVAQG